ncbi:response regulator [Psychromonas sp. SP041]|uniref:response regulator n=1 Tax=Psychromonas sp. SP041 TaxID=1365007 RepID=UPI000427C3B1|nr:response regulator [Psychromonas sp. SP041]
MKAVTTLRVFVADDSKPSKMLTIILLQSLGCTVTGADDGLEALEITSKQPFDLIFLDENMPGLLGSDVAEQLHNNKGNDEGLGINANTPKISLTGIVGEESINDLYAKGITHHIEKPVTKTILESFLKQWNED